MSSKKNLSLCLIGIFFACNSLAFGQQGLIGHWKLDEVEGMTALDAVTQTDNGVLVGTDYEWVPTGGNYEGALSFLPTGALGTVAVEVPFDGMSAGQGTVAVWARMDVDQSSTDRYIFGHTTMPSYGNRIQVYMNLANDQNLNLGMGGAHVLKAAVTTLESDVWYHIALTWDAGTCHVYVNGEDLYSGTYSGLTTLNTTAHFGNNGRNDATGLQGFSGLLDDAKLFNRALTATEIKQAMQSVGKALSRSPVPDKDMDDVPLGTVLTWKPGAFAAKHNLYLGESFADVNDATTPTAAGLDANSFDPGMLEFGTPYFWRVDEVNGTPDKTVYKGDIWSFTTEPRAILIPVDENHVTASSSTANGKPATIVNGAGLTGTTHGSQDATMWLSGNPDLNPWLMFEFDKAQQLDQMWIWNSNSASEAFIGWGIKDVNIEYSEEGVDWTPLEGADQISRAPGSPDYDQPQVIDFGLALAKYVRINILNNWGGLLTQYGVAEVQFYGIPVYARSPNPASGSVNVLPDAVASWRPGRDVVEHTVAVGTDPEALTEGQTTSLNAIGLDTFDLQLGTTYYWQVTEDDGASVWPGDIWSLSTAAYLVVDDFESYSNLSPHRPFQTWLDGFGYSADDYFPVTYPGNGTGAGIGHDIWSPSSTNFDGSIMETVNTFTGTGQSMPFSYSNTGAVSSQTERTFAVPQDWTVGGVKTLSIAFAGQADNGGTLYVKINNAKVVYEGDITLGLWQTWTIDLATVNTNLQSVTKLQIGVDGSGASGVILLDDIKLSPAAASTGNDGPTIVWVSFHGSDDVPSADAAGAGFSEAPDKAYTDLLEARGYNVVRYITTNAPSVETLNAADLVIISRSVASGGYQDAGATAWNSVTAPMIITGGYTLRSSRMGFTTGATIPDTAGDITLAVSAPNHPIFAGIELTGGAMVNPFAGIAVYPTAGTTLARGISVNTDPINTNGTLLASVATASDPAVGGMVIGEWQAGVTLTHTGGAGTDTLGGHRLVFLTGAREASGISGDTAGLYDLYEDGQKMLLNAVEYMLQ